MQIIVPSANERYLVGPAIAEGGMGVVHLGRVRGAGRFSRVVAIKRMHPRLAADRTLARMFLAEAQIAARIHHANVVQTIDALAGDDGAVFIVMEHVHGVSLARLLEDGPVPPSIAIAIAADVLRGLDAAHRATDEDGAPLGLVHRDVSAQNVLVGEDGVARLADFGIAKSSSSENLTAPGELKGKLAYLAPEIVEGARATVRSDVWSTGVTLWTMLVGRPVFIGENDGVVLFQLLESTPPLVSAAAPSVGSALDAVVAKALARDPSARFASAADMLDAIEATAVPRASSREVAAWVNEKARADLDARMAMLRAFENEPLAPAKRSRQRPVIAFGIAAAVLALAGSSLRRSNASAEEVPTSSPIVMTETRSAVIVWNAASEPVVVAVPTGSSAIAAPPPIASTKPGSRVPRKSAPSTATAPSSSSPPPPRVSCTPPYTIDAEGDRHYKPECFR